MQEGGPFCANKYERRGGVFQRTEAIIRKFIKRKLHSPFIYDMWGADLADMQLISKCNKGIHFLLCAFDIFSKNAWLIPLKDKKVITITNAFQKILDEFKESQL